MTTGESFGLLDWLACAALVAWFTYAAVGLLAIGGAS
jgi:hypothetical protein